MGVLEKLMLGCITLHIWQIERASANKNDQTIRHDRGIDQSESDEDEGDDDDDDEVGDVLYGEEEYESELSSDDEN